MELIRIFVTETTAEGLYAVCYSKGVLNEFDRLFELWTDIEYVTQYCVRNSEHLQSDYFYNQSLDQIISKVFHEAIELQELFYDFFETEENDDGRHLQEVFRPLRDGEFVIPPYQSTKASIYKWKLRKAILRLYAIRISPNTFIITGGAIKLTRTMQEHPDTLEELTKLTMVRRFLSQNGLSTEDDLIYIL